MIDTFQEIFDKLPKSPSEPFQPSSFVTGVAAELRDIADLIESGTYAVTHFSLTTEPESKRSLEIQIE